MERAVKTGSIRLQHCDCHRGGENLANLNASYSFLRHEKRDLNSEDFTVDIVKDLINTW